MDLIPKPTNAHAPEIKVPEELKVLGAQFKKGFLKAMTQGVAALDKATAGTQARAKGEQILRGAKRPGAWSELLSSPGAAAPLPIQEMKDRVEAAMNDEHMSSRLRARIAAFLAEKGAGADAVEILHGAFKEYVQRVPVLIERAGQHATELGQGPKLMPILHMASRLFLAKDDLIPESEGLYGLIDNAYLAVGVLDAASAEHTKKTGKPLFDVNLSAANQAVRELLGAEQAASLDAKINEIKDHAAFKQAVKMVLVSAGVAVAALLVAGALNGNDGGAGRLIARRAARKLGGGVVGAVSGGDGASGGLADATGGPGSWGGSTEDEIARLTAQIGLST